MSYYIDGNLLCIVNDKSGSEMKIELVEEFTEDDMKAFDYAFNNPGPTDADEFDEFNEYKPFEDLEYLYELQD